MLKSSQFTRTVVIAAAAISVGATPALAHPADVLAPPKAKVTAVAHGTRHWTQPRVDGMGVRPVDFAAAASSIQAAPLTRATDGSAGRDWLLIPLGALALAFLLILAIPRTGRVRANPFHARRV